MQTLQVHLAQDISVVTGANMGDPLSFAEELEFDDTYEIATNATTHRLMMKGVADGHFEIYKGSRVGTPGHRVIIDSCLTFMTNRSGTIEMLVLVEVDGLGDVAAIYALPLEPLLPRTEYTLVGADTEHARAKFAQGRLRLLFARNQDHPRHGRPDAHRGSQDRRPRADP